MSKKKIIYGIFVLICLVACALPFVRADKEVAFQIMSKQVRTLVNQEEFKKEDQKYIRKQYELNESLYKNIICYGPISAMEVNIVMVVQCMPDQNTTIMNQLQSKIAKQYKSFAGYAPRQATLLKKAILYEKGDYIIMIVHPNAQNIQSKINTLF